MALFMCDPNGSSHRLLAGDSQAGIIFYCTFRDFKDVGMPVALILLERSVEQSLGLLLDCLVCHFRLKGFKKG